MHRFFRDRRGGEGGEMSNHYQVIEFGLVAAITLAVAFLSLLIAAPVKP